MPSHGDDVDKQVQLFPGDEVFADFIDVSRSHGYHQIAGLAIFQQVIFDLFKSFEAQAGMSEPFDLLRKGARADPEVVGLAGRVDRSEKNMVRQRQGLGKVVHQGLGPRISVGLEHTVKFPVREYGGCPERRLDLRGVMGVIVDHGKTVPGPQDLETPLRPGVTGERGSGIVLDSSCSEDALDRNWQRLILTHLMERQHLGVLTGSPLTDVKITLAAGRAHLKHTEGGDFRQATYRAVRQGLMQAKSVLLEPYYRFRLEVPFADVGRAISDIQAMGGEHGAPEEAGGRMVLTGSAPVSAMANYMLDVATYTRGRGRLSCRVEGYRPCQNAEAVIAERGYDPESDLDNTPDSVFCAHGAGMVVKWRDVREYMHLDTGFGKEVPPAAPQPKLRRRNLDIDEKELEAIMEREFGPARRTEPYIPPRIVSAPVAEPPTQKAPERLIVDGYNVIFAWEELKALSQKSLDLARSKLTEILVNYQSYTASEVVLVFDAYQVPGGQGERFTEGAVHVVYTKENETADMYIERLVSEIGKNETVRVVTSDSLIRLGALRSGVLRTSSAEFKGEVDLILERIAETIRRSNQ